ncbi:sarcosine oxidase subunit delta [Sphingomonas sp. So64.6b]|uniref:sarcosine oxidase subunit delta n=1 Tax=Sphingomonas sp. So64.6b TaxID=2997354 RepID=UPI001600B77F|nr:sarcosine oxidase subunit delta [Sphingomonas sp. So64.6b]QNA86346.1 sarcosine oxidase subunit delta [Sphingomonas sp. So64.6b]
MLQISCPWCGPRDELEFRCGGQSHIIRPDPPEAIDDVSWGKYLSEKINPRGEHLERWQHNAGCRRWFNVARDTVTHRIRATYHMTEAAPAFSADGVAP